MVRLLHLLQRDGDTLHDALKVRWRTRRRRCCVDHLGPGNRNGPAPHDRPFARCAGLLFATPAHLERGSNENANGLLRDYFPKGTDLSTHSTQHLLAVENELNNRPRLVLNDRAPAELFGALRASENRPRCDAD
jgi:transposase, IS30 family